MKKSQHNPYDYAQTQVVDQDYEIAMKISTLIDKVKSISSRVFVTNDPANDYVNAIIENPYIVDSLDLSLLQIGELSKRFSENFRKYYSEITHTVSLAPFVQYRNLVAHFSIEDVEARMLKELTTSKIQRLNTAISDFRVYCSKREDIQTVEAELTFMTNNNIYDSYSHFCENNRDGHYIREIPIDVRKRLDKIFAHQKLNRDNHPQHVFNDRLVKTSGQLILNKIKPGHEFTGSDDQVDDIINLITESDDVQFLYYKEPIFWVLKD